MPSSKTDATQLLVKAKEAQRVMKAAGYLRLEVPGGAGRGDSIGGVGPGAGSDWCVCDRGCQWNNGVSGGARACLMCDGSGCFHPWSCGKG